MSLVLVVGRPRPQPGVMGSLSGLWGAVREEVDRVRGVPTGVLAHARVADLEIDASASADTSVAYAEDPDAVEAAVERAIARGADQVVVLPVAVAVDAAEPPGRGFDDLEQRIAAVCRRHRDAEIVYVGPPYDDPPALERALALFRSGDPEEPALLAGAVERVFADDPARFGRFISTLRAAVPDGTRIILRGSAVQGVSYKTGEPFDARGPGTSDLDVVLVGDEAMAEWQPDAFYLAGVNTMPLWDEARWVAPRLDRPRAEAQELAGRPVSLQAMALWFLDLRSSLQRTPYVTLDA